AQHLAYRMQREGGNTPKMQIQQAYKWLMYRPLSPAKLQVLEKLYDQSLQSFQHNIEHACEMAGAAAPQKDAATASLVVVANALLNLDEFITKN
ncbi:MAG TPA: hypothetical protein VG842_00075, partial [Sediminibacterium sp.]|nr:hypothetical protein [Sediminibacterium sp.]